MSLPSTAAAAMKPSVCLKDELFCFVASFNDDGVEYALCGSLALAVHGFVRAGEDIDLLIPHGCIDRVIEVALQTGFAPVAVKSKSDLFSHKLTRGTGCDRITMHLLEVPDSLSEVWHSRQWIKIGDVSCCVVSCDGLIHMKTTSGRSQDRVDVERLMYDEDPFNATVDVRVVDMSAEEVLGRIDLASELYALCTFLASGNLVAGSET